MMFLAMAAAVSLTPSCWNLYDEALTRSASAPHPRYVSYSEQISISEDGLPLTMSSAHVDYRDDGIARVADERFANSFLTTNVEPGPPELGPYGANREMWLPLPSTQRTIAVVHGGRVTCSIAGEDPIRSRLAYHIAFGDTNPEHPHLDGLWVDTKTHDILKLAITGPVRISDGDSNNTGLAQYQIELAHRGRYLVVDHVIWTYDERASSQTTEYFAEYTLDNFAFPATLPETTFR